MSAPTPERFVNGKHRPFDICTSCKEPIWNPTDRYLLNDAGRQHFLCAKFFNGATQEEIDSQIDFWHGAERYPDTMQDATFEEIPTTPIHPQSIASNSATGESGSSPSDTSIVAPSFHSDSVTQGNPNGAQVK